MGGRRGGWGGGGGGGAGIRYASNALWLRPGDWLIGWFGVVGCLIRGDASATFASHFRWGDRTLPDRRRIVRRRHFHFVHIHTNTITTTTRSSTNTGTTATTDGCLLMMMMLMVVRRLMMIMIVVVVLRGNCWGRGRRSATTDRCRMLMIIIAPATGGIVITNRRGFCIGDGAGVCTATAAR